MTDGATATPIVWNESGLRLLDQRLLPDRETFLSCPTAEHTAHAIRDMVVRGAPAIGITAAYGAVLAARQALDTADPAEDFQRRLGILAAARPTAVNLAWAVARMGGAVDWEAADPAAGLLQEAQRIHEDERQANLRMASLGAAYLRGSTGVLTHCNTGALATGGSGTALAVIIRAWQNGGLDAVYASETRPWLQGARLTAWELRRAGIPVTLLVEGASASLFRQSRAAWLVVGADRIAASGDTANKVGTYTLALAARQHGARVMVVAPTSTIDPALARGEDIPIELRAPEEILDFAGRRVAAEGAQAWNPAFDMTPAELIDVIVTERGVVENPAGRSLPEVLGL
jgi:methylthioribose-1-phosphate isomerase